MRHSSLSFAIATAMMLAMGPSLAQDHATHHAPAATGAPAKRFATDAALRKGMSDIRQAVDLLSHYERGHVPATDASAAAGRVEDGVRYIIANCKLPPDADAELHAIIVPLMQNATALKADPAKTDVIAPMRDALERYAERFEDPGVDSPEEPEERGGR